MKLHYFLTFAITSILSVGIATGSIANPKFNTKSNTAGIEAIAQNPGTSKNEANIYTKDNVAIRGTDPVAYFTQGQAVAGSSQYQHKWKGATWYFSSVENRDLFAQNPEKYTPQYGGYCAYAMTKGEFAATDPNAWSIVDGKLYLNYSKKVQNIWKKNISKHIVLANQNWSKIANK